NLVTGCESREEFPCGNVRQRLARRSVTSAVLTGLHGSRNGYVRCNLDNHEIRYLALHRVEYVEQPHFVVPHATLRPEMGDDSFEPHRPRVPEAYRCSVNNVSILCALGRIPRRKTSDSRDSDRTQRREIDTPPSVREKARREIDGKLSQLRVALSIAQVPRTQRKFRLLPERRRESVGGAGSPTVV